MLGPHPQRVHAGQRLGAGRPRLELCKIDNLDAFETIQLDAQFSHAFLPRNGVRF